MVIISIWKFEFETQINGLKFNRDKGRASIKC